MRRVDSTTTGHATTRRGWQGGQVVIRCEDQGRQVAFHVDNPTVMPEQVRLQVFQRSFSTKGADRGLGTFSMKLFGERYLGGRVDFTSHEADGTVFSLRLPVTPA